MRHRKGNQGIICPRGSNCASTQFVNDDQCRVCLSDPPEDSFNSDDNWDWNLPGLPGTAVVCKTNYSEAIEKEIEAILDAPANYPQRDDVGAANAMPHHEINPQGAVLDTVEQFYD